MITEDDIKKAAESFTYEMMKLRTCRTDVWERTPEGAKLLEKEIRIYAESLLTTLANKLKDK